MAIGGIRMTIPIPSILKARRGTIGYKVLWMQTKSTVRWVLAREHTLHSLLEVFGLSCEVARDPDIESHSIILIVLANPQNFYGNTSCDNDVLTRLVFHSQSLKL